jgi:hypothetical protein
MSVQVGEFPGINVPANRRTVRSPVNPLDKSTVVSILPKFISERKATIQPGTFELSPGTFDKPSILVVGTSSWWREVDENQPLLEITVSSIQVADSIVRDYSNGILGCNMDDIQPGLFYIPGEFSVEGIKKQHMPSLLKAQAQQRRWFLELIKLADILWSRSNGNPLAISDDARMACKQLNITNKPWLGDLQTAELVRCIACGSLRNPEFPICQSCHAIIDKEKAAALGLIFAKQ